MYKFYFSSVVGAPSPTLVIISKQGIEKINWVSVIHDTYEKIKLKNIKFSKIAIIFEKSENNYDFKFFQIKFNEDKIQFESNANCGNSMIAASKVVFDINNKIKKIKIKNIDTDLEFLVKKENDYFNIKVISLSNALIKEFKMYNFSDILTINDELKNIKINLVNVVNPYIIVDAKDLGINSSCELLRLNEHDTFILNKVKLIRDYILNKYNLDKNSEFPKIAVVLKGGVITARTVYLSKWHKGLPLTCAITIAVLSKMKNSLIYCGNSSNINILTPKEIKRLNSNR